MSLALWWTGTVRLPNEQVGVIGPLALPPGEASIAALSRGKNLLRSRGCSVAMGPIERTCWGTVGETADLEQGISALLDDNPTFSYHGPSWKQAGFTPWRTWTTWRLATADWKDRRLDSVRRLLPSLGLEIRAWQAADRETLKPGILRLVHTWQDQEPLAVALPVALARRILGQRLAELEPLLCYAVWRQQQLVGTVGTRLLLHPERIGVIEGVLVDAQLTTPGIAGLLLDGVMQQAASLGVSQVIVRRVADASPLGHRLRRIATPLQRHTVYQCRLQIAE